MALKIEEKDGKRWWRSSSAKQPSLVSPKAEVKPRGAQSEKGLRPSARGIVGSHTISDFTPRTQADTSLESNSAANDASEDSAGYALILSDVRSSGPCPRPPRRGSGDAADRTTSTNPLKPPPTSRPASSSPRQVNFSGARLERFRTLIDQRNEAALPQLRLEVASGAADVVVAGTTADIEGGKGGVDSRQGVAKSENGTVDLTLSSVDSTASSAKLENLSSFNPRTLRSPRGLHRLSSEIGRKAGSEQLDGLPSNEHVKGLLASLDSGTAAEKESASEELLKLSRMSSLHRHQLADQGAIPSLFGALRLPYLQTVEQSVTAILNLALESTLKEAIASKDTVDTLVRLAKSCDTEAIRDNAAAALCNLSSAGETRKLLLEADVVSLLLHNLQYGKNVRASRDAALGLFNLSIDAECKEIMVEQGAVSILVEILQLDGGPCEEEVTHLLASLAKSPAACARLEEDDEGIVALAGLLEVGNPRTQASACSTLLQVAQGSDNGRYIIAREGVLPALAKVVETGVPRGREKAVALIAILRPPTKDITPRLGK